MTTVDRYLARAVLLGTALVLLVLVALDRLFSFVRQLDDIGREDYNISQLLMNLLLNTPGSVYDMVATASLLGALLGLGALANNSELIVMRSSGMSLLRLVRPLLIVGVLLAATVFALGEWVVPKSQEYASRLQLNAVSKKVSVGGVTGLWLREGNRFINVQRILPGFNLRAVTVFTYADGELKEKLTAESANYNEETGWVLQHVESSRFLAQQIVTDYSESLDGVELLNPEMLRGLSLQPEMLSTSELYENVRYLKRNQLQSSSYELAFWSKFSVPISSIVMFLIALPFVLGSQRTASGGQRIFIGSLIGIAYLLVSKVASQLGVVVGMHGAVGAFFPIVLFGILAVVGVRRAT